MNNGKKIKYNLIIGFLSQFVTIALGVVVPRLILTSYGSEVNGLISSVTQIYSYIALLEAGVGTATMQALYRTIGIDSKNETNSVLAATNKYYHRTGILYLFAIIVFSIVYPMVIETEIPTITIIWVIIFNGLGSVINFFFQGKYFLLLQAEGKNYIQTSLTMFTNIFKNVAKIVLMAAGFDVVFVQAIAMVVSLIQMIFIMWYINKYYKWIDLKVVPDYKSISQSKNVMVHQISGLIFNNTDTLLLTLFCGLKVVSVYSMYTLLFSMIGTALSTVSCSFVFALGQLFNIDKVKFEKYFDCFELYYMTLVFALYSIANFFILPFLACYTEGITDINYIDKYLPLLFISTYLLSCGRGPVSQTITFAGHFKLTQNRSIFEAIINLLVSVIAVKRFGIYGVLIGTIVALLYRSNDLIIYANHKILQRSALRTYRHWFINLGIFIFILFLNKLIKITLNSYISIFIWLIPYSAMVLILFFGIVSLIERESSKLAFTIIKNKIKGKR